MGSKWRQLEAFEDLAVEKPACHHAATPQQITIFAQKESQTLVIARLLATKWLQHCSCREDIQEPRLASTCTTLQHGCQLGLLASLQ